MLLLCLVEIESLEETLRKIIGDSDSEENFIGFRNLSGHSSSIDSSIHTSDPSDLTSDGGDESDARNGTGEILICCGDCV